MSTDADGRLRVRRGVLIAALFSSVHNFLQLVLPLYSMQIFDRVLPTGSLPTLTALSLLTVGMILCSVLIDGSRTAILSRVASRIDHALYSKAAEQALKPESGNLEALRDADAIRAFLTSPLCTVLLDAPWSIAFFVAIFLLHPGLGTLTAIAALLVIASAGAGHLLTQQLRATASSIVQEAHSTLESGISNRDAVLGMGMRPHILRQMAQLRTKALVATQLANDRQGWIEALTRGVRSAAQVAITAFATFLVIGHDVQPGVIMAGSMLFGRAIAPFERLGAGMSAIIRVVHAHRRAASLLTDFRPAPPLLELPALKGALKVEDLCLAVSGRIDPVIAPTSFSVPAGTILVVVGEEGAGKSTLARLLAGSAKATSGVVRLDGSNVEHLQESTLGRQIGFLPQPVQLGRGSVAEIIARGESPDPEQVIQAATLAGAHAMIQRLPAGYQTFIGKGSCSLSAGEQKRIGLARAFYRLPPLLVLDEPTAHLDDTGQSAFIQAMLFLKQHRRTAVVIDPHPGLLRIADLLMMLEGGKVVLQADSKQMQSAIAPRLAASA
jgi:PrtD family type I secretion system ABC transporter